MFRKNNFIAMFDIDWTLVNGLNRTHSMSFRYMFEQVFGLRDVNVYDIRPHGMTDKRIILEILKLHELSDMLTRENTIAAIKSMGNYYVENSYKEHIVLMPGVMNLLSALKEAGFIMGILSGNIESIGRNKLSDALISDFFSFGAYGDMSTSRSELVEFAETDMQKNGINAQKNQFVIIGDSARDIECAKDSKLPSIGVATGSFSKKDLQLAGASLVVNTLEDKNLILKFFSGV